MSMSTALVERRILIPCPTEEMTMSSGPFTYSLGAAAAFVVRSLMERPDLQTPEEVAGAPHEGDEIDAQAARKGLAELASRGIATEGADGRWRLTDAGREAAQQST
jgi:hypothetical protein